MSQPYQLEKNLLQININTTHSNKQSNTTPEDDQ